MFVDQAIETRNKIFIDSQNLKVNAKDEFIEIFKKSKSISTMKGKSFLSRVSRITKSQQKLETLEEEKIGADIKIKSLKECLRELNEKTHNLELQQREYEKDSEKLAKLYEPRDYWCNADPVKNNMS